MELQEYISRAFPEGLSYNDTAQLCLRLYCTSDGVPSELPARCTKNNLPEVFSRLARNGFVKPCNDEYRCTRHAGAPAATCIYRDGF